MPQYGWRVPLVTGNKDIYKPSAGRFFEIDGVKHEETILLRWTKTDRVTIGIKDLILGDYDPINFILNGYTESEVDNTVTRTPDVTEKSQAVKDAELLAREKSDAQMAVTNREGLIHVGRCLIGLVRVLLAKGTFIATDFTTSERDSYNWVKDKIEKIDE